MESVREARVCRRSRCCGGSEQTLRLFECRPLCGQSHTCARNPALCAENAGEGSNFARNGGDVFADKPMWRFGALPPHRSRRRLRCPFNALAPQERHACAWFEIDRHEPHVIHTRSSMSSPDVN